MDATTFTEAQSLEAFMINAVSPLPLRILALDPGKVTGFALLSIHRGGEVSLDEYGVIYANTNERPDICREHWDWLVKFDNTQHQRYDLAYEAPLFARTLPSNLESQEVRGVIDLFSTTSEKLNCFRGYPVPTVKAMLTHKAGATKKEVEVIVRKVFKIEARFPADHMPDAIAVGVTHLAKEYGIKLVRDPAPALHGRAKAQARVKRAA